MVKRVIIIAVLLCLVVGVASAQWSGSGAWGAFRDFLKKANVTIAPSKDDTYDLGSEAKAWRRGYLSQFFHLPEISAPSNPSVNTGVFYVADNAGTTTPYFKDSAGTATSLIAGGGAPSDADYLVGTANATLTAEIVAGTAPGGSLGGTWASPTIDDLFLLNTGDIGTGVYDFGGADSFEIPNAAAPTTDATGEIALDTTITDHQPFLQYYDGGENMSVIAIDTAELPALDNEIVKYDAATDKFVLEADAGGAGSPGGADTQVQFNDSSAFGGDADLTWNKTTNALTVASGGTIGVGTTTFSETTGATDSGGYIVGLFDEFAFSAGTDVQTVVDDLDAAIPDYYQFVLLPSSAVLDDNNPPAITVIESTGTGTPRRHVADFDATTDELCYWTFTVPDDMASGNWLVDVYWYANDIGANEDAIWGCAISATTEADLDAMSEDAVSTIDYAAEDCNSTEANRLVVTTITLSDLDSVAASDIATLAFRRDADNTKGDVGGDGLTSDARLTGIRVRIPRN